MLERAPHDHGAASVEIVRSWQNTGAAFERGLAQE
jgi:hypothetical protein